MTIKWGIILELLGVVSAITFFVYQSREANPQEKVILWVILGSILVLLVLLISFNYLKVKMQQIERNKVDKMELKKDISMRRSLEEINYKLGKLERKK